MPATPCSIKSLIAMASAIASLFSYGLTSRILDSGPTGATCVNSLDLDTLTNASTFDPDRFVALQCSRDTAATETFAAVVSMRSLNP